uniref:C2H2-type domain-containing protein n=4 Tax=Magallana gigas TaxID=29159 RepID=A0A8W8LYD6_MAGGI|nr:tRNA dimethylallyltransferase isoform X1 [Crassostrea gigas]
MAASIRTPLRVPVVFILGATGTGKSKLALEIGSKFNGEIISTDSMQIYKGLDIVTNKVTVEEQEICPHHMINYLSPLEENHHVHQFRNKALPIIEKLLNDKKMPIIVGGTNYYIESLLWNTLIKSEDVERVKQQPENLKHVKEARENKDSGVSEAEEDGEETNRPRTERDSVYQDLDTETLYKRLQEVDPVYASRTHPNNRRKLLRALEVFDVHGTPMSEIHKAQRIESPSNVGELRYPNTCVLWVQSEQSVLDDRTNKRVNTMIERGLIQELLDFHKEFNAKRTQENRELDYTTGIFQSIGFKEFHEYLILPEEEKHSERGKLLFEKGVENMKIATRQYARRQIYWIKNRLLRNKGHNYPPVYSMDSTDVSHWTEKVHDPAVQIVQDYMNGVVPQQEPLPLQEYDNGAEFNECKACNKTFVMRKEWNIHIKSAKHKKRLRSLRKRFHDTCDILDQFKEKKSMERETTLAEMTSRTANIATDSVDGVMRDCVASDISDKEAGPRDIKSLDTGTGAVNLRDMVGTSNEQSEDKGESVSDVRDKVLF